jgi:hypothetical protein
MPSYQTMRDVRATEPYVQFYYAGRVQSLTREQYEQALRDARMCKCRSCLCCTAVAYHREVTGQEAS